MNAEDLRSKQDREIARQLMEVKEVKRINEMIEKREEEGPMGTRRRLLATSVRLSRGMAPWLHEMADDCIENTWRYHSNRALRLLQPYLQRCLRKT